MAKTIIQTIGPLYGEVVNGTVFGRPNGSIYVPPTNLISISAAAGITVTVNAATYLDLSTIVTMVAQSQDLASNMFLALFSDSDCTVQVGLGRSETAGQFNRVAGNAGKAGSDTITPGTTYYLRAQLLNNGSAVATSNVITVVGA